MDSKTSDSFGARSQLRIGDRTRTIHRIDALADRFDVTGLPYSLKVLLENLLRTEDGQFVTAGDIEALAGWDPAATPSREIAFTPARVLLQDFTGVPAVVDLAAMRDAMAELGGNPQRINPLSPADLVIDHSVVADVAGVASAFQRNADLEFQRNQERYTFLRWGQQAFDGFRVVPPDTGIVHQVNLEHLASVIMDTGKAAYPDTLVGTDSHTPMVNGLGVLGWGVGGIEAEAAMLGQAVSMLIPQVIGFRLSGELPEGATATDLVLTVTQQLRHHGVVGAFVEFFGPGIAEVPLANRATIGNMSPEYGSTVAIFPVDATTLDYLRFTGRNDEHIALVEAYTREQGLFWEPGAPDPRYTATLELDLSTVQPSLAGPSRPQDRVALSQAPAGFRAALADVLPDHGGPQGAPRKAGVPPQGADGLANVDTETDEASALSFPASDPPAVHTHGDDHGAEGDPSAGPRLDQSVERPRNPVATTLANGSEVTVDHGHVVLAAITSCTNTSNPSVMIAAGLLAKKAVERGLASKPWVKTSLAPGSQVVMDYYERAGLLPYLEKLGFHLVGFGCTSCIGNSGPLDPAVSEAVADGELAVAAVLSGNRNFEGRINPDVRLNYLGSPPLVVAYALAGTMDVNLTTDALGTDAEGREVYLRDIWPTSQEIEDTVRDSVSREMFVTRYADVFTGDERWRSLQTPTGERFAWDESSTYVQQPPFFQDMAPEPEPLADITGARVLALLGDSVTTDHISPAGVIKRDSPAGRYLMEHGVDPASFNSYGSRRGNHEVMVRGTFANIRLRNRLVPGVEGGMSVHLPTDEQMPIFDAAMRYAEDNTPLVVLAGKEYGSGSSRDWAAKGTLLLGVRAVIAESYERIHRSNLIGMGILPLQFAEGETAESHGLSGRETFSITGLDERLQGAQAVSAPLEVTADDRTFRVIARLDTPMEVAYLRHGGILPYVLRQLLR